MNIKILFAVNLIAIISLSILLVSVPIYYPERLYVAGWGIMIMAPIFYLTVYLTIRKIKKGIEKWEKK